VTDLLLDTAFFIDLHRGRPAGANELWREIGQGIRTAAVSPITIYELWVGQRMDRAEEVFYEAMLTVLEEVPLSGRAARLAGVWLRSQASRSEMLVRDSLIAATAAEVGAKVVTANERDFVNFPSVEVQTYS
jgi:predicted nucleic acid-binding protein